MKNKLLATVAALSLFGLPAVAMAQAPVHQPMQLSNSQMDNVTAGSLSAAFVWLTAAAAGSSAAFTETTGGATILQVPVVVATPLGPVTFSAGAVLVGGSSTSSN